ncbi:pupal cuticle protein 20-like [Agrilus planipennis]|uniref:Pupal cuticle protein 20-like n=1 Tax=Agrilus planipennis TaxID=224129 RepID=A0A1W4X989_AGRPL|nr:pupal cuticle protein 20-like [Agrilus planipennis]
MILIGLLSLVCFSLGSYNPGYFPGGHGAFFGGGYYPGGPSVPINQLNNANNGEGNYAYSYQTGNGISARESGRYVGGLPEGGASVAEGSYSFTAPDGHTYSISYTADENGFHPVGAHIPTPPPIPEAILRSYRGYHYK